jgi:hypothetical protein
MAGIFLLRVSDLFITFLYTPDLASEWNPLVSLFGASWPAFIAVQLLIVAFAFFLMFFYFSRTPTVTDLKDLSFNDFIYVYFFGKLRPWPQRIFSRPTDVRRHLVFNGFFFMLTITLVSMYAIINNLLLLSKVELYCHFIARHYATCFPAVFIGAAVFSVYLFFGIEYARYKKTQRHNPLKGVSINLSTRKPK